MQENQLNAPIGTSVNSSLISQRKAKDRQKSSSKIGTTSAAPINRNAISATASTGRARRQQLGRQLDELMVELAYAGMNSDQPLVMALLEARERRGSRRIVLEDAQQQRLSWQALFTRAARPMSRVVEPLNPCFANTPIAASRIFKALLANVISMPTA